MGNFSLQLKTDAEKRSTADETWDSPEDLKKSEDDFDSHGDGGTKWKGATSGLAEDAEKTGQKAGLSVSQTGSWRRGMSAQGGTPARQKTGTSALKTPGKFVTQGLRCRRILTRGAALHLCSRVFTLPLIIRLFCTQLHNCIL